MKTKRALTTCHRVKLRPHEQLTVDYLLERGFRLELIPISPIPGVKTPDLMIDGIPWEMKTFSRLHWRTIERSFRRALNQAPNIIYDLRNFNAQQQEAAIKMILKAYSLSKAARRLLIITKSGTLETYQK
ncbi:hypothetical protein IJJ08_00955 [bacterium]|nr:hypothetical protein [bacterium]